MSTPTTTSAKSKAQPSTPVAAPASDVEIPLTDTVTAPDGSTILADNLTEAPPQPEISAEDKAKAINKAYGDTTAWLRTKYRNEFNAHQKQLLAALGIDWDPAPTKQERARTAALKLLAEAGVDPSTLTAE